MNEEDIQLFREVALLDRQLEIGTSIPEEDIDAHIRKQLPAPTCSNDISARTEISEERAALLALNKNCRMKLKKIHKRLLHVLAENERKQEVLRKYLQQLKSENLTSTEPTESYYSLNVVKCTGIPYFKDVDGFPQPQNDDVKSRLAYGRLLCADYFITSHPWNKQDKEKLKRAVSNELEKQNSQMNIEGRAGEVSMLNNQANSYKRPVDWLKISATDLNGKYSSRECESMWHLDLAPEVNHRQWSLKEIEDLKITAEKHCFQNWDIIASELGTGRNGYQCCIKYHMKNSHSEGKWSHKEDILLRKLVNKFKVDDRIHWTKVMWFFETRSRKQCMERYYSFLQKDLKKGCFSTDEDKIIIYGVRLLHNFGEVAKFLPGRIASQIRSRYYYLVGTTMPKFSEEEDKLLVDLVKKHPGKWLQISEAFLNRSKVQCRLRYSALIKNGLPKQLCNAINKVWTNHDEIRGCYQKKKGREVCKPILTPYDHIMYYHELCTENYFGPRIPTPRNNEELIELSLKLKATMAMLSITPVLSEKTDIIKLLQDDCNFDQNDIKLLIKLSENKPDELPELEYHSRGEFLMPPNYTTLVGLETLLQSRMKIRDRTRESEGLIPLPFPAEEKHEIAERDTPAVSAAKALFQKRMETLFTLSLSLVQVPTTELNAETFHRRKMKKPKTLSRKRRKAHAKSMYLASLEAKKKKLEGCRNSADSDKDDGDSQGSNL